MFRLSQLGRSPTTHTVSAQPAIDSVYCERTASPKMFRQKKKMASLTKAQAQQFCVLYKRGQSIDQTQTCLWSVGYELMCLRVRSGVRFPFTSFYSIICLLTQVGPTWRVPHSSRFYSIICLLTRVGPTWRVPHSSTVGHTWRVPQVTGGSHTTGPT